MKIGVTSINQYETMNIFYQLSYKTSFARSMIWEVKAKRDVMVMSNLGEGEEVEELGKPVKTFE